MDKNEKNEKFELIKELLDKEIELETIKQKKSMPAWKIVVLVFAGIISTAFLAFSCYMMYKQSFTIETLLTVLLSFFSIGLSIMFYIQSEKSSAAYYSKSYDIMKEVSVVLGKIEAGFGEKLAEIKANIEKMENKRVDIESKLEQGEKEENEIKNKLVIEKSDKEREKLVNELQSRTKENVILKRELDRMNNARKRMIEENSIMREQIMSQKQIMDDFMNDRNFRNYIIHYYNKNNDKR